MEQQFKFIFIVFCIATLLAAQTSARRRIYGGVETSTEKFPWAVIVYENGASICSGSIITDYHVLTAGRCFGEKFQISENLVEVLRSDNDFNRGTFRAVEEVHVDRSGDIAVLKVDSAFIFSKSAQPITLRNYGGKTSEYGIVGGWGQTLMGNMSPRLRTRTVSVVDKTFCREKAFRMKVVIDSKVTCTTSAACFGDTGGPLVINGLQVGIFSTGLEPLSDKCTYNTVYPNVFTNVGSHKRFIESITGGRAKWSD